MNFDGLSKETIARIASYMNYEDTCQLMRTSKKCYEAIKEFGMDKIKLKLVKIHYNRNFNGKAKIETIEQGTGKQYKLKSLTENDTLTESIKKVLKECQFVNCISFAADPFHSVKPIAQRRASAACIPLIDLINKTETKIRRVELRHGLVVLGVNEFGPFCKKFKGSEFSDCDFLFSIWSDEVLTKVLPYTQLWRGYCRKTCYYSKTLLTDRTLKALVTENDVQTKFTIPRVVNSFTVKQIVKNLEVLRERNIQTVRWQFGTLPFRERTEVEKYFNHETGELKDMYHLHKVNEETTDGLYLLSKIPDDRRFSVEFFVHPTDN